MPENHGINDDIGGWLESQALEAIWAKGPVTIARRRPESRRKPGTETPYPNQEVACLVISSATLGGVAQGHLNELMRWKDRGEGRWIAVFAPSDISEVDLVGLQGFDQLVRTPIRSIYPDVSNAGKDPGRDG